MQAAVFDDDSYKAMPRLSLRHDVCVQRCVR